MTGDVGLDVILIIGATIAGCLFLAPWLDEEVKRERRALSLARCRTLTLTITADVKPLEDALRRASESLERFGEAYRRGYRPAYGYAARHVINVKAKKEHDREIRRLAERN